MPRLLIFAVCEKVIIDDAGMASLIGLFSRISIAVPKEGIPPNAVAPKEWAAFTSWTWDSEDEGKEFDQLLQVLTPSKNLHIEVKSKITKQEDKTLQFRMPLLGIPVGEQGFCTVKLSLAFKGSIIVEPEPILIKIDHVSAILNTARTH